MKKLLLLYIAFTCMNQAQSQIPDNTDGRLYRVCKVWGYVKYFSKHKCTIQWDTLLNTTINEVLLAGNNTDFNIAVMNMLNKVGNNTLMALGQMPDTNFNFDNTWINDTIFTQPVRNFLDTFSLYTYPDYSTCLIKANDFSDPNYYSYIDFRNDTIRMNVDYTNEANRLSVMFYYWNVINYFHAARNLMDQPWDNTLFEYIPAFRQANDDFSFELEFLKMATKTDDSHGFNYTDVLLTGFWGGPNYPSIYFTRIDTNCVVKKVNSVIGISPGDILLAINGVPILTIEDSLKNYIPASTPAALYRDIYYKMLRGVLNSSISLTVKDSVNNINTISTTRSLSGSAWFTWIVENNPSLPYYITQCGYGYIDMNLLQSSEVPAMYTSLQNTPAIIFDMRNYPNGTLWDLGSYFFPGPIVSAIYYLPALTDVPSMRYFPGWYYQFNDSLNLGTWSNATPYNGKVYILVNHETQSQAEYTCQYLSYHPNAKVIGTQTAGADGNISYLKLPNNHEVDFTSLGWYFADGYQQQRNGVKIDSVVSPTITGIRAGRDEILEAALDCLTGISKIEEANNKISIYPNPVTNNISVISFNLDKKSTAKISLYDLTGNIIRCENYKGTQGVNTIIFSFNDISSGMYLLSVDDGNSISNLKVVVY